MFLVFREGTKMSPMGVFLLLLLNERLLLKALMSFGLIKVSSIKNKSCWSTVRVGLSSGLSVDPVQTMVVSERLCLVSSVLL